MNNVKSDKKFCFIMEKCCMIIENWGRSYQVIGSWRSASHPCVNNPPRLCHADHESCPNWYKNYNTCIFRNSKTDHLNIYWGAFNQSIWCTHDLYKGFSANDTFSNFKIDLLQQFLSIHAQTFKTCSRHVNEGKNYGILIFSSL